MPQIPRVQEGQILNPGSPVPIDSPAERRLSGEALESFGKAAVNLAGTLNQIEKQQKAAKQSTILFSSKNKYEYELLRAQAEEAARAPDDDPTGFSAVDRVKSRMDEVALEIANEIPNEDTKALFLAKAGETFLDPSYAAKILAQSVKKREAENEVLLDESASRAGQILMQDPSQLENKMGEFEMLIHSSPQMTEFEKSVKILKGKRTMVSDTIQGYLNRKDFKGAMDAFNINSGGLFNEKEKQQAIQNIEAQGYKENTRVYNAQVRADSLNKIREKEQAGKMSAEFYQHLVNAGTDPVQRAVVIDKIHAARVAQQITEAQAKTLIGSKTFAQAANDKYEAEIVRDLFEKKNYVELRTKVSHDMGTKLDAKKAVALQMMISRTEQADGRNPERTKQIQGGVNLINQMNKFSLTNPGSALDKQKQGLKVEETKMEYRKLLAEDPNANPTDVARKLLEKNFGTSSTVIEGVNDSLLENTAQGLDELAKKTYIEWKKDLDKSPANQKKYIDKFEAIKKRKQEVKMKDSLYRHQDGGRPKE